jgi:hypothetical protein
VSDHRVGEPARLPGGEETVGSLLAWGVLTVSHLVVGTEGVSISIRPSVAVLRCQLVDIRCARNRRGIIAGYSSRARPDCGLTPPDMIPSNFKSEMDGVDNVAMRVL